MESQEENRIIEQAAHAEPRDGGLHVCLECDSGLVYPVDWEEADEVNWLVLLRCPNCFTDRDGIFDQESAERFDEEIDRGADVLLRDYKQTVRANMLEELELFVAALDADAILPEDF